MVTDPSKDMVTALGLGGVVQEFGVGHSVQRPGSLGEVLIDLCGGQIAPSRRSASLMALAPVVLRFSQGQQLDP